MPEHTQKVLKAARSLLLTLAEPCKAHTGMALPSEGGFLGNRAMLDMCPDLLGHYTSQAILFGSSLFWLSPGNLAHNQFAGGISP